MTTCQSCGASITFDGVWRSESDEQCPLPEHQPPTFAKGDKVRYIGPRETLPGVWTVVKLNPLTVRVVQRGDHQNVRPETLVPVPNPARSSR